MNNLISIIIAIGIFLLMMLTMNLAFRCINLIAINEWKISTEASVISMVVGFFLGIGANIAYFEEEK